MKIRAVYIAATLALFAASAQAQRPIPCASHAFVVARLAAIGERVVATALLDESPFYIYANLETGAWTALIGRVAEGQLCFVAEGQGWSVVEAPPPGRTL